MDHLIELNWHKLFHIKCVLRRLLYSAAAPCVAAASRVSASAYAINSIEADVENEHYCITKRHNGFIILYICERVCMFLLHFSVSVTTAQLLLSARGERFICISLLHPENKSTKRTLWHSALFIWCDCAFSPLVTHRGVRERNWYWHGNESILSLMEIRCPLYPSVLIGADAKEIILQPCFDIGSPRLQLQNTCYGDEATDTLHVAKYSIKCKIK